MSGCERDSERTFTALHNMMLDQHESADQNCYHSGQTRGDFMKASAELAQVSTERRTVTVEHARIETRTPFPAVKTALEDLLPPLDTNFMASLRSGDPARARRELQELPDLSILQVRDHGQ